MHFFIDYVDAFCLGVGRIEAFDIYSYQYCIVRYMCSDGSVSERDVEL